MKNQLFIFAFVMMFSLILVNASWTERAVYSEDDLKVEIKSWWGFFEWMGVDQTVGSFELKSHPSVEYVKQVGVGEQVTMYYDFDFKEIYENGLGDVKFIDMKTGEEVKKDYKYVYLTNITENLDVCLNWSEEVLVLKGQIPPLKECIKYGKEEKIKEKWEDYNYKLIPKGNIRIGIMVDSKEGDYLDGVWVIGGKDIIKHATWNSSFNTGLVAYWNFDNVNNTLFDVHNKLYDYTAYRNGTIAPYNTSGFIEDGQYFLSGGGNGARGFHANHTGIRNISTEFTFNIWLNQTSYSDGTNPSIFTTGRYGWSLGHTRTTNRIHLFRTGTHIISSGCPTINNGWVMWTITFNSGNWKIYRNSTLCDSGTTALTFASDGLYQGFNYEENGINGTFDDAGLWTREFSQSEIALLYDSGSGMTYPTIPTPTLNLTIDKTSPQTYGETINISCATDSNSTLKGYINNSEITLNTNILLGAGLWDIKCNVTENDYWGSATNSTNFTINKATPSGTIIGTTPIGFGSPANIEGTESNSGDGDVNYTLYRNSTLVSNPDLDTTLAVGTYFYVYNTTGGANYTAVAELDNFTLAVEELPGVVTVLTKPDNNTLTKQTEILMYANISAVGGVKLKNYTAYVWDNSDVLIDTQSYDIESSDLFNYNATHTTSTLSTGNYKWNFETCSNDSSVNCSFGITNRTLEIDTVLPSILATLNETVLYNEGDAVSLLYSITDDNLASCFYEYNGSNNTITCGEGLTEEITTTLSDLSIIVFANDTAGNYNSYQLNLTIDPNAPTIIINSGNETVNFGYTGMNHTINFTVNDTNLEECWVDYIGFFNETDWIAGQNGYANLTKDEFVEATIDNNDIKFTLYFGGPFGLYLEENAGTTANWSNIQTTPDCDFSDITARPQIPFSGNIGKYICVKTLNHGNFVMNINASGTWRYKPINRTVSCTSGIPNSLEFEVNGTNYYARINSKDTVNNYATRDVEWDYEFFEAVRGFSPQTVVGFTSPFYLTVTGTAVSSLSSVYLNYDGVNYTSSITSVTGGVNFTNSILISGVERNVTFYWIFNFADGTVYETTNSTQEVLLISLDNCSTYSNEVITLKLYNEQNLSEISGEIEAQLLVYSEDKDLVTNTTLKYTGINNVTICSETPINTSQYLLSSEIRYTSEGYTAEFYYIQYASMEDYPVTLDLYSLNLSSSTEFLIKYQDDTLTTVEGAVVQLLRKYINEGIYRTVEAPLTSNIGTAIVHVDLNTQSYRVIVIKDGVVLDTFDNLVFNCENELSGQCTQNLFGKIDAENLQDVSTINDFSGSVSSVNNTVTFTATVPSGTPALINVVLKQRDVYGNDYLCNRTALSSSVSLDCDYNDTIGDSYVDLWVYKNGELMMQQSFFVVESGGLDWLDNNFFIVFILLLSVIGMAMSSPEWMIINAVVTLMFTGGIWLLSGMSFVVGLGTLVWLVIASVILIMKISKQEDS